MNVSEAHGVSVIPPGLTTTNTFIKFSGDSVHGSEHYHDDDGGGVGDDYIQYDDGNDEDDLYIIGAVCLSVGHEK